MSRPPTRPPIAGPDAPAPPFPLKLRGPVIKGFGRGSSELGIPTANIPLSGLSIGGHDDLASGIYYGFASLEYTSGLVSVGVGGEGGREGGGEEGEEGERAAAAVSSSSSTSSSKNHAVADLEGYAEEAVRGQGGVEVYPTVLSVGYNPYYKNTHRSIEIHILHSFAADFYGATLSLVILGFIRPEYDYVSKEALVEDIREDIRVARRSLGREAYLKWREDEWLLGEREGKRKGVGQLGGVAMCQME